MASDVSERLKAKEIVVGAKLKLKHLSRLFIQIAQVFSKHIGICPHYKVILLLTSMSGRR